MHYAAMMLVAAVLSVGLGSNTSGFSRSYDAAVAGEYGEAFDAFTTAVGQAVREADVHNQGRRPF